MKINVAKTCAGIAGLLILLLGLSCGGSDKSQQDICNCVPTQSPESDFRHNAKHVPLPSAMPAEINVDTILSWPLGPDPAFDAPRQGRELQLFHISRAFLEFAWERPEDCDLTLEISQVPDKTAPRVIVETPIESEYCSARRQLQKQLAGLGEQLNTNSGELHQPRQVEVTGLAFRDFAHGRGTAVVATLWELHPAVVNVTQ